MDEPRRKQRILIVDDVPQNITVLNEILKPEYSLQATTIGKKALEIARSDNPPDLILLDIMMPEMDGYEVLRQLKSDEHTHGIPVVFVSAKGEIEDKTPGYDIADYLTKPVDPAIVLEVVKRILTTTT